MGGQIKKGNTHINLVMSKILKEKIQEYARNDNRSMSNYCVRILDDPYIYMSFYKNNPGKALASANWKNKGMARINLVVSEEQKNKLIAEAEEAGRSLNNYIVTKLLIFCLFMDPDFLKDV